MKQDFVIRLRNKTMMGLIGVVHQSQNIGILNNYQSILTLLFPVMTVNQTFGQTAWFQLFILISSWQTYFEYLTIGAQIFTVFSELNSCIGFDHWKVVSFVIVVVQSVNLLWFIKFNGSDFKTRNQGGQKHTQTTISVGRHSSRGRLHHAGT